MLDRIKATLEKAKRVKHQKHTEVLQSFAKAHVKWGSLTSGQVKYFESIEASYSPAALEADAEWVETLKDPEYRKKLKIVAEYYARTGYYSSLSGKTLLYLNGLSEVAPERSRVAKMMDNKYAQSILESTLAAPMYAVGDLVQLRGKRTNVMTVIEVDSSPITKSLTYNEKRGGTRMYRLLPFGTTDLIQVMERDLKRPTKKLLRGE